MDVLIKITQQISLGTVLKTPSGRSDFIFDHIDPEKVQLLVGKNRKTFKIPASLFDNVFEFLNGKDWIRIGATHGVPPDNSVDEFVQIYMSKKSAASYVASILEKAGIVEINRDKPARMRLKQSE